MKLQLNYGLNYLYYSTQTCTEYCCKDIDFDVSVNCIRVVEIFLRVFYENRRELQEKRMHRKVVSQIPPECEETSGKISTIFIKYEQLMLEKMYMYN